MTTLAPRRRRIARFAAAGLSASLVLAACGDGSKSSEESTTSAAPKATTPKTDLTATLNGQGATFPKAFYEVVFQSLRKGPAPNLTVNYQANGSGAGQTALADQVAQFAGSDTTVKPEEKAKFKGGAFLYFPTVAGPVTLSYNVDGAKSLNLSGEVIAGIFQCEIVKWNDPKIAADNAGVTLPDAPIVPIRRADASGTTANFTKYLTKAAPSTWKLGTDKSVQWGACTQGGNGNGGVASSVKSTKGAIGYVDFADASAAGLTFASVKNASGKFVAASLDAATAAVAAAKVNDDLTYDPLYATGDAVYPITAPTYLLVYEKQSDANTAKALQTMLTYVLSEGQEAAAQVFFAKLPADLQAKALAQITKVGGGDAAGASSTTAAGGATTTTK